jgi:uncharacterized repeat protein (TIGR01451 family)
MVSRGIWWYMAARTRRSLVLAWTALFVVSLLMQYASFGAQSVKAAVNLNLFELDGNATASAAVSGDDWSSHPGATGNHFVFIEDQFNSSSDKGFTGGGSKDDLNTSSWAWETATVTPDKDDIEHAFAAAYKDGAGHTQVYFGLDKLAVNGDSNVGFWFFKNGIHLTGTTTGGFAPVHSVGDLLVVSQFTNGGQVSVIDLYEWVGSGGDTNGTLDLIAHDTDAMCTSSQPQACAIANDQPVAAPWSYTPKSGAANTFPTAAFFEGGIDLDSIFGEGGAPCFSGFLAETRSSQSVDAVLKDVAVGDFNTCEPPAISTTVSDQTVDLGDSVTDTADFTNNSPAVTGSVKFFVCGPDGSNPDCSTGGTQVGGSVTITSGHATSAAFSPTAAGKYCFRAEYTPDANGSLHYVAGSHTNQTTECFTVAKAQPSIVTSADQTVLAGATVSDTAVLSGGFDPSGTITFKAYGPDDDDCSAAAAYTTSVAVSGNGSYGPVSFTPDTAGTYHWIASYSGDANNSPAAGACGDDGENDTVNKVNPTISTSANETVTLGGAIHDSATLAGGTNPTGTITFKVYGTADCSGAALFTTSVDVDGNKTYGPVSYTPGNAGTYHWIASYSGDANNNPVSGACGDAGENDTVNKLSPSIATELVSGETNGTNLTLPLGSTVHDTATLSGATATAGGTVAFTVYSDSACTQSFAAAGSANVVNGIVGDSSDVTFNQAGTYYWQAVYSGDANNNGATSACTSEVVTIVPNSVVINTRLSGQGQDGQHITVQTGNPVTDSATLTGESADAGGTVTYTVYSDSACATVFANAGTFPVTNGSVPNSNPVIFTAPGTYYWKASYSGDANNEAAVSACTDETVTVIAPDLTILKSFTGNSKGIGPGGIPQAAEGDTLTYTLTYDLTNGPVHNAVIWDTLPVGLTYVSGSATNNAEFTFDSFNATTRVLTWVAPIATTDGSVTYKVKVAKGSAELPQPLINVVRIVSDETDEDQDDARVLVAPPPLAATATPRITLPPTDTLDSKPQGGRMGFSLMLVLLGIAGFVLAVGFITPAPARVHRRSRRG